MGLMGLLRESYSHQCPSIRPTMNNPWFLVACPVLMGALGILYTETENGSDRNPKTRQPFGGDDGFHPNHSLRLWLDAQGLKKMFFLIYLLAFVNKHVRKHWKKTKVRTEIYVKHEGKALKIGHFTYCCYFIIISILMKLDFAAWIIVEYNT